MRKDGVNYLEHIGEHGGLEEVKGHDGVGKVKNLVEERTE